PPSRNNSATGCGSFDCLALPCRYMQQDAFAERSASQKRERFYDCTSGRCPRRISGRNWSSTRGGAIVTVGIWTAFHPVAFEAVGVQDGYRPDARARRTPSQPPVCNERHALPRNHHRNKENLHEHSVWRPDSRARTANG